MEDVNAEIHLIVHFPAFLLVHFSSLRFRYSSPCFALRLMPGPGSLLFYLKQPHHFHSLHPHALALGAHRPQQQSSRGTHMDTSIYRPYNKIICKWWWWRTSTYTLSESWVESKSKKFRYWFSSSLLSFPFPTALRAALEIEMETKFRGADCKQCTRHAYAYTWCHILTSTSTCICLRPIRSSPKAKWNFSFCYYCSVFPPKQRRRAVKRRTLLVPGSGRLLHNLVSRLGLSAFSSWARAPLQATHDLSLCRSRSPYLHRFRLSRLVSCVLSLFILRLHHKYYLTK